MTDTRRELILQALECVIRCCNCELVVNPCEEIGAWTEAGGGKKVKLLEAPNPVKVGSHSLGLSKKGNDTYCMWVNETLAYVFNGTDREARMWFYVKNKLLLANAEDAVKIGIGNDLSNYWSLDTARSALVDVDNDATSGWNYLGGALPDAFHAVGNPTITDLNFIAILLHGLDNPTTWEATEMIMDHWVLTKAGFPIDIKRVYRYSIGAYAQIAQFPAVIFGAIGEELEPKTYPSVFSKLRIMLKAWQDLSDSEVLDYHLGLLAGGIQQQLMDHQTLQDLCQYVRIKSMEFSVMQGAHRGVLTMMIEIGYLSDLRDPTAEA